MFVFMRLTGVSSSVAFDAVTMVVRMRVIDITMPMVVRVIVVVVNE